jgi:hypothetical protein
MAGLRLAHDIFVPADDETHMLTMFGWYCTCRPLARLICFSTTGDSSPPPIYGKVPLHFRHLEFFHIPKGRVQALPLRWNTMYNSLEASAPHRLNSNAMISTQTLDSDLSAPDTLNG